MGDKGWRLSRRQFLKTSSAAAAAIGMCIEGGPALADIGKEKGAIAMQRFTGEPYALAGRRLVFTSWYYVRPAQFKWYDKDNRPLPSITDEAVGPWDATFRAEESPYGIRLAVRPAEHVGPLITEKRPWEAKGISLSTIIHSGGSYRAWGVCQSAAGKRYSCYLVSADGLEWTRPDVGQIDYEGTRSNNLLDLPRVTLWGWSVFEDPSGSKEERYKAVKESSMSNEEFEEYRKHRPGDWAMRARRGGNVVCVAGAVSPDGLRWRALSEKLVVEHCDTQPVAYYDSQLGKYVLFTRTQMVGPSAPGWDTAESSIDNWQGVYRRSIGRSESSDFRRFPVSETILEPGPDMDPSAVLYANARTTIPGAPDHHVMFPTIYQVSEDTTSISFATSADTGRWHLFSGSRVLKTTDNGEWDGGCVFAHPNLIELPDGSFALPYTGYIFPHKYPRGRWSFAPGYAVWPKGRLVGVMADDRGEFATAAIVAPGRKLRINAVTKRAGGILVQVDGLGSGVLPGRSFADATPIIGDCHWTPVTWKGQDDIGAGEHQPIILRFRLDKAQIYGLQFE